MIPLRDLFSSLLSIFVTSRAEKPEHLFSKKSYWLDKHVRHAWWRWLIHSAAMSTIDWPLANSGHTFMLLLLYVTLMFYPQGWTWNLTHWEAVSEQPKTAGVFLGQHRAIDKMYFGVKHEWLWARLQYCDWKFKQYQLTPTFRVTGYVCKSAFAFTITVEILSAEECMLFFFSQHGNS